MTQFNHIRPLDSGSEAVVALAHPDDEFMLGGIISALRANGMTLHAYVASDGEASTRGDQAFVRSGGRRWEASKALGAYGIRREHQHFAALPDGGLSIEETMEVITADIAELLAVHAVTTLITLGREGYDDHTDHVAVHQAALGAFLRHGADDVRLYSLTRNEGDTQIPADPTTKLDRLSHHDSQFGVHVTNRDELLRVYAPVLHLERYDITSLAAMAIGAL